MFKFSESKRFTDIIFSILIVFDEVKQDVHHSLF